ncbi:hypothetical protein CU098_013289 [Rhizopus stolonifer]|uniref:Cytochrome P450-dit2 n=1 Tax=Rhizopus stolonifer TaxID=4846 RepID=A0A367KVG4_RHIST|nr:hypothetical protein CU098_013289 [Rhizopus stolonifer]
METYYSTFLQRFNRFEKSDKVVSILGTVAATGLATYCIKKAIKRHHAKQLASAKSVFGEIPTPEGAYYYLGHIPLLGKVPAFKITEWHQKLGPILRIKMGVQEWVFISEPNTAHEFFVAQGAHTSGRPYMTWGNGILGEGERGVVFVDYGKQWKNARTAILDVLSPKSVDGFHELLQGEAEHLVNTLIEQTERFGKVDPITFVRCSSVNIILAAAFGISGVKSADDPLYKQIIYIMETGLEFANVVNDPGSFFPILSFLDIFFRRERVMRKYRDTTVFPLLVKLVQAARESKNNSLVKKLDLIKEEFGLDEQNILVLMSELLVAGSDTVAASTLWTFSILCNHPQVQKKLQDEVDTFINRHGRIPTFADRLELPYFIAFQKECLRFRPPALFNIPRKASKDVVYKNYIIPKGTVLLSNIHTLHNDSNTYPEPEKFIPERFLGDSRSIYACSNGNIQNRDQFVFGWGRRMCPGIYLAENELFNTMTRVMARCEIKPVLSQDGTELYPDLDDLHDGGATVQPNPYNIRFAQRENRLVV